jgi:aminoglycoside phosphotransferase (APT) family kinase protein
VRPPAARALDALRDALAPGGDVVRVRPMRGGVSCSVHSVRLADACGVRRNVVVRRYGDDWQAEDPAVCTREFKLLDVLSERGFPVPRPLLLDQEGSIFGAPTIVMTRLGGRAVLSPRDVDSYLQQLAEVLVALHRVPTAELDFLPRQRPRVDEILARGPASTDPLEARVWAAVRGLWPSVAEADRATVIHGDYWPGNTVWQRGRLNGIVDWEMAQLGDPARDVATCCCDLSVLFDIDTANEFIRRYERIRGAAVADLPFWSLFVARGALRYMHAWVAGYHALGRTDLDGTTARARVAAYTRVLLGVRPKGWSFER